MNDFLNYLMWVAMVLFISWKIEFAVLDAVILLEIYAIIVMIDVIWEIKE